MLAEYICMECGHVGSFAEDGSKTLPCGGCGRTIVLLKRPVNSPPIRIQRKRTRGWKKPDGCVNCTRPGRYGNPHDIVYDFRVNEYPPKESWIVTGGHEHYNEESAIAESVELFDVYAEARLKRDPKWLDPLRGHDLMCWCNLKRKCHVDTLLRLANR